MSITDEQEATAPPDGTSAPGEQAPASASDQAAPGGWFDCIVNYTGPAEDGHIYIHLRQRSGQFDLWYRAHGSTKREMLATALTAISTGLPVTAQLTTTDEYGTINRIYVHQ